MTDTGSADFEDLTDFKGRENAQSESWSKQ